VWPWLRLGRVRTTVALWALPQPGVNPGAATYRLSDCEDVREADLMLQAAQRSCRRGDLLSRGGVLSALLRARQQESRAGDARAPGADATCAARRSRSTPATRRGTGRAANRRRLERRSLEKLPQSHTQDRFALRFVKP